MSDENGDKNMSKSGERRSGVKDSRHCNLKKSRFSSTLFTLHTLFHRQIVTLWSHPPSPFSPYLTNTSLSSLFFSLINPRALPLPPPCPTPICWCTSIFCFTCWWLSLSWRRRRSSSRSTSRGALVSLIATPFMSWLLMIAFLTGKLLGRFLKKPRLKVFVFLHFVGFFLFFFFLGVWVFES